MRRALRRRHGFTLLEVIVALTLTAIAGTIAASALGAARRTADVVEAHHRGADAATRLRALLTDALRHGVPAREVNEPLLQLTPSAHGAVLQFLSRGIDAPYGTGPIWRVTVRSDGTQLVMDAEPLATGRDARVHRYATIPGVTRFDARVLEAATAFDAPQWRADWPLVQARPVAAELSWPSGAASTGHRLVVSLDPLAGGAP